MVADEVYEICLPVLQDDSIDDDDKTDKLEQLLRKETGLTGKSLENAVLDCLWRHRDSGNSSASPPPTRHTIIRRPSPAPWQANRAPTPVSHSPRTIQPPPGFGVAPPAFTRAKSSNASPFTSPRPSPRLAFSSPHIPHSPSLSAYQFSETSNTPDMYGDLGSDSVDWLVNDDSNSTESSSLMGENMLNASAAEFIQPSMDMGPYDMLRSILKDDRPDEEIEEALKVNSYDITAALLYLMGNQAFENQSVSSSVPETNTFVVGKSLSPSVRPATPAGQARSNVVCKYFLSTGHCARADCRFSHDTTKTLCKYFLNGNCLAGDTCLFSHDPSSVMARMAISDASTPPSQAVSPNFQMQDYDAFPSLGGSNTPHYSNSLSAADAGSLEQLYKLTGATHPPPGLSSFPTFTPGNLSRPQSRPGSRHHSRAGTPSVPAVDDNEAFPSLGSAASKPAKRHHGKRGDHGHNKDQTGPNNLADVVRMSPGPTMSQLRKTIKPTKSPNGSRENSAAAQAIPAPQHIPWLETGEDINKAYLKARGEAFKHGSLRNKFLQSAAQAWNRNDSRAAKALSLRGQAENNLMREAHREAARVLYEERNKDTGPNARELYVDLHGLHPEEAVSYLEGILTKHSKASRPVYAITGTGHHSKNGKDKVGKAIRAFLTEWRYAFREFSVPGDRNNVGGILGIDPSSYDRTVAERSKESEGGSNSEPDGTKDTKVIILKRDEVLDAPKGPRRAGL
ncbi:CCCH zinc finger and SMR domain-containing protein [Sporormia fimetaria CBS 119925]|uniref:CCCH zinc finger and SMR domain-containing protein n=1 Tax=Sporormia fimetaria CBS 119925 TaxID=1340428 RepID=A0A6A6VMB2_9PLEO|nr:CCCH zinc finger and SMR domain-containing protein [Sporormia fimetaria CBS 119925]